MGKTSGMWCTCKGLLIMAAGVVLMLFGLGMVDSTTAHIFVGAALALTGLGALIHCVGMCPMCKAK